MATLSTKDVQKIADLAKLQLQDDQLPVLTGRLKNILDLVRKMNDVDTQKIAPLAHPLNVIQPLREDTVTETNQRDLFLQNAPRAEAGLYIVPKFVEVE